MILSIVANSLGSHRFTPVHTMMILSDPGATTQMILNDVAIIHGADPETDHFSELDVTPTVVDNCDSK